MLTDELRKVHERLAEQLRAATTVFEQHFTLPGEVELKGENLLSGGDLGGMWFLSFGPLRRQHVMKNRLYVRYGDKAQDRWEAHEAPEGIRALAALAVPTLHALLTKWESEAIKTHTEAGVGMTKFLASHGSSAEKVEE